MSPEPFDPSRWFAEEVAPHGAELQAYLKGNFPTLPDVDDVVQESLVRVLRAGERGGVESARALLFATARNLARDQLRRGRVIAFEPMTENSDSFVSSGDASVAESVSKNEEFDLLREAIQSLPDRCRQVFTLRMAFGLSQREIAQRLGISENTVEKQMGKGFRRCTEFFAQRGLP